MLKGSLSPSGFLEGKARLSGSFLGAREMPKSWQSSIIVRLPDLCSLMEAVFSSIVGMREKARQM